MGLVQEERTTREKILDVAEGLFARRGYSGVGMREVAEGVGLRKSSIFHHFDNKAALYTAVSLRILGMIEHRLVRSLAQGGEPRERLERVISELVDLLVEHPNYAKVLLRSLFEDDDLPQEGPEAMAVKTALAGIMNPFAKLLREGMSAGQIRLGSPPHMILLLVGTIVFPFASGEFGDDLLKGDVFDEAEVRRLKAELLDLVTTGLAPGARK